MQNAGLKMHFVRLKITKLYWQVKNNKRKTGIMPAGSLCRELLCIMSAGSSSANHLEVRQNPI
jgi:hypothetical protein